MIHEQMYRLGCKCFCFSFLVQLSTSCLLMLSLIIYFSGLPHYDPRLVDRMKKNRATLALVDKMKKLAGLHQTMVPSNRGPTDSELETETSGGSNARKEGGGESQIQGGASSQVQGATPSPVQALDSQSPPGDVPPPKKMRVFGPGADFDPNALRGVSVFVPPGGDGGVPSGVESGSGSGKKKVTQVKKFSLKEITDLAGSIPEEKDWKVMERLSRSEILRRNFVTWAQVGDFFFSLLFMFLMSCI